PERSRRRSDSAAARGWDGRRLAGRARVGGDGCPGEIREPLRRADSRGEQQVTRTHRHAMNATDRILGFLDAIGLPCRRGTIPDATVVPGIFIENGGLVYDAD